MVVVKSQVLSHATGNDQNNGRLLARASAHAARGSTGNCARAPSRSLAHLTHRLQLLYASQCSGQSGIETCIMKKIGNPIFISWCRGIVCQVDTQKKRKELLIKCQFGQFRKQTIHFFSFIWPSGWKTVYSLTFARLICTLDSSFKGMPNILQGEQSTL